MYQIAICDTEQKFCQFMKEKIILFTKKWQVECNVMMWHEKMILKNHLERGERVDLLFLDIGTPEDSGVVLGEFVRGELGNFRMQIVYVSCEKDHGMRLFHTEPMDVFVKPVGEEELEKVLARFIRKQMKLGRFFTYRAGTSAGHIPYDSILFFQSMNHKILIHSTEGRNEFYGKLNDVEEVAPNNFMRIHQSFLVNEFFVRWFNYEDVILQNGQKLSISKPYRGRVQSWISSRTI